jgi:hypothetical protein
MLLPAIHNDPFPLSDEFLAAGQVRLKKTTDARILWRNTSQTVAQIVILESHNILSCERMEFNLIEPRLSF